MEAAAFSASVDVLGAGREGRRERAAWGWMLALVWMVGVPCVPSGAQEAA